MVNAQVLKTDFLSGYTIGEVIEKGTYVSGDEAKLNQWTLTGRASEISGTNPLAVSPLIYDGYVNSGKDVAIGMTSLEGSEIRASVYTLAKNGTTYLPYGSTFYFAFTFSVSTVPTDPVKPADFFAFMEDHIGQNFRQKITVLNSSGDDSKYKIGIFVDKASSTNNWYSEVYDCGQTHLVVLKITFDGQDPMKNGSVSVFIDPEKNTAEPTPSLLYTIEDGSGTEMYFKNLRGFAVRQMAGLSGSIGGFVLADSWNELWDGNPTSVENMTSEKEVESVKYYNLNGVQVSNLLNEGIYIEKIQYRDGEIVSRKITRGF